MLICVVLLSFEGFSQTVTPVASQTVCSGITVSAVTFSGSGTVYDWSSTGASIGLAANGTGGFPAFVAINTSTIAITAVINVVPDVTGTPMQFSITVKPTPTGSATPSNTMLCSGTPYTSNLSSSIPGTTYTWSVNLVSGSLSAPDPFSGSSAVITNTYSGNAVFYYTVSPTFNGCSGPVFSTSVTLNPLPTVGTSASSPFVCSGMPVTLNSSGSATSYTWSHGVTNGAAFTPTSTTVYTLTGSSAAGCIGTATRTILVEDSPMITIQGVTNALCYNGNGSATISASGGTAPFTYSWSGGATTSVISNMAGVYTATVTDANSCSGTNTVLITQPTALVTNIAFNNALCYGGNGSATISASGGTSPYTYSWSSGATTSVMSGLAGVYSATVTDANNCSTTNSILITQPTSIVSNTAVTNAVCYGGNGSATISASGGTGAFTYSWSGGATTSVMSGLAGVHNATVTDANNCSNTNSILITQPTTIIINTVVTAVLCNGGNGSATISASGGTGAFTYSWSGGAGTSVMSGLAGVHTVTVTDANNCSGTNSIFISQPTAIVINTAVTAVLCNGGNGSATISASGGTGAFTYSWSSGATTSFISGLAGIYTATVTDANNCTAMNTVAITQPLSLVINTLVTNVACFGGNGNATIIASGGIGPYTYLWSTAATTSVISNVIGVYSATVTDANNCTSSATLIITQPPLLTATAVATNALCNAANGNATITASGGTGPYTYMWPGPITTSVMANLAGAYTATVTDANNCQAVGSVTITQPPALTLTATPSNTTACSYDNVYLSSSGSGGTGAVTYSWTSGPITSFWNVFGNGMYTITITDANNCKASKVLTITANPSATITASSGTICPGQSFTITASGATYFSPSLPKVVTPWVTTSYLIDGYGPNLCSAGVQVTVTVLPLPVISTADHTICAGESTTLQATGANTYTFGLYTQAGPGPTVSPVVSPTTSTWYYVTGTGTNSCVNIEAIGVFVNTTSLTVSSGSICSGNSFSLNPSGAATYTWSGGSNVVSPTVTSTYSVIGTGTNGCVSTESATAVVTVFALPTLSLPSGTVCQGSSFTLNPAGASTYTYLNGGPVVSPLLATTYSVIGTNPQGCLSGSTATALISVNNTPTLNITGTNSLCVGNTTTLTVTGGDTYLWDNNNTTNSIIVSPSTSTIYSVVGTTSNNCSSSLSYSVVVNALPTLSVSSTNSVICKGETVTLMVSGGDTYLWDNNSTTNSIIVSPSASTIYSVVGTTSNNCSSSLSYSVVVNALPTLSVSSTNSVICNGETVTLTVSGGDTYLWDDSSVSNSISVSPSTSTVYSVIGTTSNNCSSSLSYSVSVNPSPTLSVSSTNSLICQGETATLTVNGATSYTWSTGSNNTMIIVSPTILTTYSVIGVDDNTCVDTVFLTQDVSECSGINTLSGTQSELLRVYPNPNSGVFTIETTGTTARVVIINSIGQLVQEQNIRSGKTLVDLQEQKSGLYTVHIISSDLHKQTIRLIKQ